MKGAHNMLYKQLVDHILTQQETFYKIAYSYVKSKEDALDIVQDSIEKSLKSYKKIKEVNYISTWFYRVLVNTAINHLKKRKPLYVDHTIEKGFVEEHHMDLYEALDQLKPDDKTLIILRYFQDLKFNEIADIMSLNINTLKTRHKKILDQLKIQLDEGDDYGKL